jgi:hypothetical protein
MNICPKQKIVFKTVTHRSLFFALCCVGLLACGGPKEKGAIEVRLKDHREAIGDFSNVKITIASIRISPKVSFKFWQLGWVDLAPSVEHIDLTQFVDRPTAKIFGDEIAAGSYEAIDVKLSHVEGVLKKESAPVSISNKIVPVALPFAVNPGEVTMIVLDLAVMDMSDHPPQAYELQLGGYEVYRNGKLVDKVPPG